MIFVVEIDGGEIKIQDKDGNFIDSTLDGAVRRLLTQVKGEAKVQDKDGNLIDSVVDGSTRRLLVDARIAASGTKQKVYLIDGVNEIELAVVDDAALPANTRGLVFSAVDGSDTVRFVCCDAEGKLRVAAQPPSPPPGTTEFVLASDTPLAVGPNPSYQESESAAIGNSDNLYIQSFSAGAAGDPSEKGSKVEVYWREGVGPTDHLIGRIYLSGQTVVQTLPDVNKTRDGTALTGDGSTTKLVIRRERLSNSAQEIDAEVRGYTT